MISYMLWLDAQLTFRVAYVTTYLTDNEDWLDVSETYSLLVLARAMLMQRVELLRAVAELQTL